MIYANKSRHEESDYKIGDKKSRICDYALRRRAEARNFIPHYIDPFKISKAESAILNCTLKLPSAFRIHPKIHAQRLKITYGNDPELFPGRISPNPSLIDVRDEQYAVEVILNHFVVAFSFIVVCNYPAMTTLNLLLIIHDLCWMIT